MVMETKTPKGRNEVKLSIDGSEFMFKNPEGLEIKSTVRYSEDKQKIIQRNTDPKGVVGMVERYMEGKEMHLKITRNGVTMVRKITKDE